MNESKCPNCGAIIPADAPEGVCPACALGRGLGVGAVAQMNEEEAEFRRAELETLASAFPEFELLELLGRGGMGEVYKARQKKLNRLVAIKILPEPFGKSDEYTERFHREAQSLARLNHPNIVTIYDYGEASGLCYFAMEFVDGVDLRRMIEARTLTPAEALRIVPQICDALQFAHDQGIVHRDIKPANILIDKQGRVKIADFGLAKIVGQPSGDFALTATGDVMGTAEYMAPEQRRASQSVDHRADIYSLGVVFYEMLTGEVPMGKFDPPSQRVQVDVRIDDVVLRTLEREPERRYQKVSEVKSGVETICQSGATNRTAPQQATARGHRCPPAFAALATAGFLLVWFGTDALWNLRWPGVWLSGVLIFAVLYGLTALGRRWFPIIATNWRNDSGCRHTLRLATALALCLMGFYFVLGGAFTLRERAYWSFTYRSIEDFAQRGKDEDYKFVRQLTAYEKTIPKVELVMHTFKWTRGIVFFGDCSPNLGMFPAFGIWAELILGFVLLANSANALVATSLEKMRPDPTWRLYIWPLLALGLAMPVTWCLHQIVIMGAEMTHPRGFGRDDSVRVPAPIDVVRQRVETALVAEGFVLGESGEWLMSTVPEGKQIGTVAFGNAWKLSPFDRWQWRGLGFASVSPQVQAIYIASDQPAETKVRLDVRWPGFHEESTLEWPGRVFEAARGENK